MGIKKMKIGKKLVIGKNCTEIPMNRYFQARLSELILKEGLKKIGKCAFGYTDLKELHLPNSLEELGYRAFEGCEIEKLTLGNNLTVLEDGTFLDNRLNNVKLTENIKQIKKYVFKNNSIIEVEFNNNLEFIGEQAFSNNLLTNLEIPNSVKEIGIYAFANNKLVNVKFGENYTVIDCGTFKGNKLKNINLTNNITKIDEDAFACNEIESLTIPETVKEIGPGAFMENYITELNLNHNINKIPTNSFYNNKIEKLEIPSNVQIVGTNAFFKNNINDLKLNEGLKIIEDRAFRNNNFTYVEIPSTVVKIGSQAFDYIDVLCKGQIVEKELVSEFGSELILKIADCKNTVKNINFDLFYPIEVALIPADNDSLKGFINSNKKYRIFEEEVNKLLNGRLEGLDYYKSFFKLNYIFGTFRQNPKAMDAIKVIYQNLSTADIEKMMSEVKLTKFDKKFADVMINAALEGHIEELIYIVPHVFNNLELTKKGILKIKELEIMKLNKMIKHEGKVELQEKLNELKKNKNKVELKDVLSYVKNNLFEISEKNKELVEYTPIFNGNIKKYEMANIEEILNKAKLQKENKFNLLTDKKNEYSYKWLDNKDPLNLVLGYLVNCCAKYKGAGEDIMIQSMTNPNFKNLVIYKGSEVVAKSTAFYNDNYILCNNIEVSDKYMKNKNNMLDEKRKLLEMIVKGLKDQAEAMNQNGNNVDEIRIGMSRNDLNYIIEFEQYNIEKNNLLKNYEFKRYQGDANNKAFGQAIIYKK